MFRSLSKITSDSYTPYSEICTVRINLLSFCIFEHLCGKIISFGQVPIQALNPDQMHSLYTGRAIEQHLDQTHNQTYRIKTPSREATALMFAFIHGLVELNASGHLEAEKALDDAFKLIHSFVDLLFYRV